ncbi:MAG: SGNH/GDSL hydrolase family protein [Chloroflexota bacterium]
MKKNLLLLLIATLSPLIVVEIGLRVWVSMRVDTAPPIALKDKQLGWRPNPQHPDHDHNGFRNKSVPEQADIVAMGDSQTYGMGVLPDQAWPQQLAALDNTTVYNLALGGYGPGHSLVLFDDALDLKPKLIIEAFYAGNDAFDAFQLVYDLKQNPNLKTTDPHEVAAIQQAEQQQSLIEKAEELYQRSTRQDSTSLTTVDKAKQFMQNRLMIYHLFIQARNNYLEQSNTPAANDLRWSIIKQNSFTQNGSRFAFEGGGGRTIFTPDYRLAAVDLNDPRIGEGHRIALEAIGQMKQQADEVDIQFAVLLIPTKELVFKDVVYQELADVPDNYRSLIEKEELFWQESKHFFTGQNITFLDTLPALREVFQQGEQPYQLSRDGHPNHLGHQAIAELVSSALLQQD